MPKRSGPPSPMMRKTGGRLAPLTAVDDELLSQTPDGQIYELVLRKRPRSNRQNDWYWGLLGKIVDGTGAWPTSQHLHRELLKETGRVTKATNLRTGEQIEVPDSTAFDAMQPAAYNAYLNDALALLSETFGFDITELMPPRKESPDEDRKTDRPVQR